MQTTSPYTHLPGTTLRPFRICFGTVPLGSTLSERESFALLDAYLDAGGNFIDTAKVYADWLPNEGSTSEKTLGRWLQARRCRERIILATKGAHPELDTMHVGRLSPEEIAQDLEASLRHLQTGVIDLYWLHRDDPARPVEGIIDALNDHVRAGKVRYFGASNWRAERIRLANEYAAASGQQGFAANQPLWNLARINPAAVTDTTMVVMDAALYACHLESRLPLIPYTALANGLFNKLAEGRFDALGGMQQRMYAGAENLSRFERAQQLSHRTGLTLTQVVLGYLLSQPFPTIPIIGSRTPEQLAGSLAAAQVLLDPDEVRFLLAGQPAFE